MLNWFAVLVSCAACRCLGHAWLHCRTMPVCAKKCLANKTGMNACSCYEHDFEVMKGCKAARNSFR